MTVITFTSDFGTADHYVAAMKAAVLKACPGATLVDVTHEIPPQDVVAGVFVVERAVAAFGVGTIHLAVVDPGVGTDRRLLAVRLPGQVVLCPDNGLITWAVRRIGGPQEFFELTWRPGNRDFAGEGTGGTISNTFHGRDILAPAAGMLAAGAKLADLARPIDDPILLDMHLSAGPDGRIIYIDRFGNATTNIPAEAVGATTAVSLPDGRRIAIRRTFADVPRGEPVALIGSSELLEIAVNGGSAAEELRLGVSEAVRLG